MGSYNLPLLKLLESVDWGLGFIGEGGLGCRAGCFSKAFASSRTANGRENTLYNRKDRRKGKQMQKLNSKRYMVTKVEKECT